MRSLLIGRTSVQRLCEARSALPWFSLRANSTSAEDESSKYSAVPNLPVNSLDNTIAKYLRSVRPLLTDCQYETTKGVANKFLQCEGPKLQELLEARAQEKRNWLEDWWLGTAYLEYRDPVALFSSPALVWPSITFKNEAHRLLYTATLITNALCFNQLLENCDIPQEKAGKDPLDMSQYFKVFGTTRIPLAKRDELEYQDTTERSDNIIVMCNNNAFSLTVLDNNREILSYEEIYSMLLEVVEESKTEGCPVGVLTSDYRDKWARAYTLLCRNVQNLESLQEIERALFVVCLDKPLPCRSPRNQLTHSGRLLLHGSGYTDGNAANRWFDKTIQFVIGADDDGVGVTYEHTPAEGGPIGVMADFVLDKMKDIKTADKVDCCPRPKKLEFVVTPKIQKAIEEAGANIDNLAADLDAFGFKFDAFGKNELKKLNTSPDSFIQIAIQYAFYKVHNKPAAQYESATLRKYHGGRTDVIRTTSLESLAFCQSTGGPKDRLPALQAALAAHKAYAVDAMSCRGVDRHLLGLKLMAVEIGDPIPQFYRDVGYTTSTYFQLSTSNVPAKNDCVMIYAPLVADGYACCYNPRDDDINFGTSAWKSCPVTDVAQFQACLTEALKEMRDILASAEPIKSKL